MACADERKRGRIRAPEPFSETTYSVDPLTHIIHLRRPHGVDPAQLGLFSSMPKTSDRIAGEVVFLRSLAMRRFVRSREDAEDLAQDTVLTALRFVHRFQEGTNLRAWLTTIMRHTYINHYRKDRRCGDRVEMTDSAAEETMLDALIAEDVIERAISLISCNQKAVVLLRYKEGLKYEQIAERLGIPVGTVRSQLHRARQIMRPVVDRAA